MTGNFNRPGAELRGRSTASTVQDTALEAALGGPAAASFALSEAAPATEKEEPPLKPPRSADDALSDGSSLTELILKRLKEDPKALDRLLGRKTKSKRKPRVKAEVDAMPPEEWVPLIRNYPDPEVRALAALLFLCGPRISEALARPARHPNGQIIRDKEGRTIYSGFTARQFGRTDRDGRPFVWFRFVTLKRGDGKPRTNYVLADVEPERTLLKEFLSWTNSRTMRPDDPVFRFTRQNAHTVLAQATVRIGATRLNPAGQAEIITVHDFHPHPHFFRHSRLTDLSVRYGFNEQQQRAWTGWKTTSQASTYTHTKDEALAGIQISRAPQPFPIPLPNQSEEGDEADDEEEERDDEEEKEDVNLARKDARPVESRESFGEALDLAENPKDAHEDEEYF